MTNVPDRKCALLIHYYYPPIRSAAVLRNYFFSLEFAKRYDQVFVITTSNRNKLPEEQLPIPANITIVEAPTYDYRVLVSRASQSGHLAEHQKRSLPFKIFGKLQKTLPFHFLLGEGGWWYILKAVQLGKTIVRDHEVKLLYSSFGPYADHLIASRIKKRHPQLKWIADFRDLQIEPLYRNVYFKKWQGKIEHHLLRGVDLVTTISEGLRKHLQIYNRPTISIPRGVTLRQRNKAHFQKFTICYTGSLYQGFRDADYFFSELTHLIETKQIDAEKMQFIYAGRDGHQFYHWIEKNNLKKIYQDYGYLSRKDTLELQNKSHLQLLLTSATPDWGGVLTGKIFEYIESGNPVLVLVKGEEDLEFEEFMNRTGAGIVCYDPPRNETRLAEYLIQQYVAWQGGDIKSTLHSDYIERELSWSKQADRMLSAVSEH